MKKCKVCADEFADEFVFCPIDGKVLSEVIQSFESREFNLTMIGDAGLSRRLWTELQFVREQIKQSWPDFKKNPVAFTRDELNSLAKRTKRNLARPHVMSGAMTAMLVLAALISSVLFLEKHSPKRPKLNEDSNDPAELTMVNLRQDSTSKTGTGVGAGEKGRVGFGRGKGEGSAPVPARSQGGGSGGDRNPNPPSQGKPPQPSVIPAPISTTYARLPRALPAAGLDIDPVLWKELPFPNYGDPRSKSTTPSNGPGEGGGVGTNNGLGVGEGNGNGVGPGNKRNIGGGDPNVGGLGKGGGHGNNPNPNDVERVYSGPEVTTRARIISKPEPQYTEEARKENLTGTVILRVVFSRTGQVTNIQVIQRLGGGLTEKAIAAARQIRFVPATKNGQPVPMYMQLEYNFNLY